MIRAALLALLLVGCCDGKFEPGHDCEKGHRTGVIPSEPSPTPTPCDHDHGHEGDD